MLSKIFVNLPVKDLEKSKTFFKALGFSFNPQFTDETAACMMINDSIYSMLLTHPKAKQFTPKEIADAHKTTEVMITLSADSREEVSDLIDKAVRAGGREPRETQDYGFMFSRAFEDPDGHLWAIIWMNPAHVRQ